MATQTKTTAKRRTTKKATTKTTRRATAAKPATAKRAKAKAAPKTNGAASNFDGFRTFIENQRERIPVSTEQFREQFDTIRTATADAGDVIRSSATIAADGTRAVNLQILENVQNDANRFFEMTKELAQATSLREAAEIQGQFIREQFQNGVKQTREIAEMVTQVSRDSVEPISKSVGETFKKVGLRRAA